MVEGLRIEKEREEQEGRRKEERKKEEAFARRKFPFFIETTKDGRDHSTLKSFANILLVKLSSFAFLKVAGR